MRLGTRSANGTTEPAARQGGGVPTELPAVTGNVYLGGGGSGQDEALVWAKMLAGCRRLLYWPIALDATMLGGADAWLSSQLHHHDANPDLVTWTSLEGRCPAELGAFDLLFVGGGNTFSLLAQMRDHGFVEPVQRFVQSGGNYYGGSAGAIVACDSIEIAAGADSNDVRLKDLTGLSLLTGIAFLPHYTADQKDATSVWSHQHGLPVLAVPERAGVVMEDGGLRAVGPESVWKIDGSRATAYDSGDMLR